MANRLLKLDYIGITISISVTNVSSTYFGLYDDPRLQAAYITFSLICALNVLRSMMDPSADGPKAAFWRYVEAPIPAVSPPHALYSSQTISSLHLFPYQATFSLLKPSQLNPPISAN